VFTYLVVNKLLATYYAAFVIRELIAVVRRFVRSTLHGPMHLLSFSLGPLWALASTS
jgi:hypothetical protein